MDQILEMAKELGAALQQDDRYIRVQMASAAADADEALQQMIGEFNLQRMALSNEAGKEDHDEQKMEKMSSELRALYEKIMSTESMKAYNDAHPALETLIGQVSRIITLAAQGEDPYQVELNEGCSGSCATCGGCH